MQLPEQVEQQPVELEQLLVLTAKEVTQDLTPA
jgi:hypothetical protein